MSERFKTVREAFIRIDTDGDGFIGPPELRAQLELMGMRLSGREYRRLWRMFDSSGDDQLNYVEFNNYVGKFIKPASMGLQMNRPETPPMKDWQMKNVSAQIRKRVTDIDATFNEIDQDGSGVIDQTELMIALRKLGLRGIGDQECFSMMNRFRNPAKNKTPGTMTREEFKACMTEYLRVPEATLKSLGDDERMRVAAAVDAIVAAKLGSSRGAIAAALARFDSERLHDLSHAQLRDALAALGAVLTDAQWAALCSVYDPEKDGSFGIGELSAKLASRLEQAQREAHHGASGGAEGAWARLGIQPAVDPVAGRRVEARLLAKTIAPRLGMSEGEVVLLQALMGREGQARMAWERYDRDNTGEVTKTDFVRGIEDAGAVIPVAGDLLTILASRFDRRKSGRMSYADLLATYGKFLELNHANVAALGFEWLPGFGKFATGPDSNVFKKGSHAAAYAGARLDHDAANQQQGGVRQRGQPPVIVGSQQQQQQAAALAHQAQQFAQQQQQQQEAQQQAQQQRQQQQQLQLQQQQLQMGQSQRSGGRASGLANAGRKIAGGGYSGGGNGQLSTSPMRGRESGAAAQHAGHAAHAAHAAHGAGAAHRDADADSLPDMSKTSRKLAGVLGRRGWPAAADEMRRRAERDAQRGLALGGGQPGGPSLWATSAPGATRPAAAISADVLRDTLAKHGVPLTGREAAQLAHKYADKAGSIDLARLARDAGLA
jgi:Ca2+-binding EF-hand superfamily protein